MENNNKKNNTAIALKYNSIEDVAPKVIAKGKGEAAGKIVEKAEELNIPVYQDKNLVDQLNLLEISEYIPEELYEAVAQILIFISGVDSGEKY